MDRKSPSYQYWFIIIVSFSLFLGSCQTEEKINGGIIPSDLAIKNPFDLNRNLDYINNLIKDNDDPLLKLYRAKIYLKNHLFEKALTDLKSIQSNYQNEPEFLILQAKTLLNLDKRKDFLQVFNKIKLEESPTYDNIALNFEWFYQDKQKDSVQYYLNRIGDFGLEESNFPFTDQLEYWIQNDSLALLENLNQLRWQEIPSDLELKIYFDHSDKISNSSNFIHNLNLVLNSYPLDFQYYPYIASENFKNGNYKQSKYYFEKYKSKFNLTENQNFQLAFSCFKIKDYDTALKYFITIKPTNPNFKESQFYIGLIYLNTGKSTLGYEKLDSLVKIYEFSPELKSIYSSIVSRRISELFENKTDSLETNEINP